MCVTDLPLFLLHLNMIGLEWAREGRGGMTVAQWECEGGFTVR